MEGVPPLLRHRADDGIAARAVHRLVAVRVRQSRVRDAALHGHGVGVGVLRAAGQRGLAARAAVLDRRVREEVRRWCGDLCGAEKGSDIGSVPSMG